MIRRFKGLGEPKIEAPEEGKPFKTGFAKGKEPTDTPRIEVDEVDPAEFFDPEEFGVRRREWHPSP